MPGRVAHGASRSVTLPIEPDPPLDAAASKSSQEGHRGRSLHHPPGHLERAAYPRATRPAQSTDGALPFRFSVA